MSKGELSKQSIKFSVSLIEYYKYLVFNMKEFIISKQLLRSGTSIGANIHEAQYAISKADFINKLQISLKEASETEYWLTVLEQTGYKSNNFNNLTSYCKSLKIMLISALKTCKNEGVKE